MLNIIDRRDDARGVTQTRNERNIYSHGRENPRRDLSRVNGIILHHTNFASSRVARFDYIVANYVVMRDGTVLYVRDVRSALNSVGTDRHAVDIEFVGDYHRADAPPPPDAQVHAGRQLIRFLVRELEISHIYAHAHFTRKPCPGPYLWYNVGAWASRRLGLDHEGATRAIPSDWNDRSLELQGGVAAPHFPHWAPSWSPSWSLWPSSSAHSPATPPGVPVPYPTFVTRPTRTR